MTCTTAIARFAEAVLQVSGNRDVIMAFAAHRLVSPLTLTTKTSTQPAYLPASAARKARTRADQASATARVRERALNADHRYSQPTLRPAYRRSCALPITSLAHREGDNTGVRFSPTVLPATG